MISFKVAGQGSKAQAITGERIVTFLQRYTSKLPHTKNMHSIKSVALNCIVRHRHSQGGAEGGIASPNMPKNTFLTKKLRQISLIFCPEPCTDWRLTAAIQQSGVPPKTSAPSKTHSSWLLTPDAQTTYHRCSVSYTGYLYASASTSRWPHSYTSRWLRSTVSSGHSAVGSAPQEECPLQDTFVLVTDTWRSDHVSPVLRQLHWLPVRQRVDFKVATLVH